MTEDQERELLTELRDLQRQLYGPGADGAPSEADVARLAELERLIADARDARSSPQDEERSERGNLAPRETPLRRAVISFASAGVAAVLVAAALAGVAGWNLARAADSGEPLAVSAQQEWPSSFDVAFDGQRVRYADYYGVQVGVVRGGPMDTELPQACLVVDAGSGVRGSCSITEFGASIDVVVDSAAPEELRAKYAESTVLRFSLRDGKPYVRSSATPTELEPS